MKKREYYLMFDVEKNLWWYKGLREVVHLYIRKLKIKKDENILDTGCGTGMNIEYLYSLGYKISGIDVSSDAVALTKRRGVKDISKGTITKLFHKDASFDIVLCLDVMGLLDDKSVKKALEEINRVLKKGGYLFLHCAALEWLRSQHDEVSNVRKRYSRRQLIEIFDPEKWEFIKVSYRMFLLFMPLALIKLIKKFLIITNIHKKSEGDLFLPNKYLNSVLNLIQSFENLFLPHINYPIGTSLFVIVKKK